MKPRHDTGDQPPAGSALLLVSHALCPYAQRVAIALREKGAAFERRDIDLADKPAWFLAASPLGKVPLLLVGGEGGEPLFESAVICEYLDDALPPKLHPGDALERARHRAWVEFASHLLQAIAGLYNAPDAPALQARARELRAKFERLEAALGEGPYFAGAGFSLVDAAFGPVFRYFDVIDRIADLGLWDGLARLTVWRAALVRRESVALAVAPDYAARLGRFLRARDSELGRLAAAVQVCAAV